MRNQFGESGEPRIAIEGETSDGSDPSLTAEFFRDTPITDEASSPSGYEPSIDEINERAVQLNPYNEQPADVVMALAREQLMSEHARAIHDAEQILLEERAEAQRQEETRRRAEEWNTAYEALVSQNREESQNLIDAAGLDEGTCTDLELWEDMDALRGYTVWQLTELAKKQMRWFARRRATDYAPDDAREDIHVTTTMYDEHERKSGHVHINRRPSEERPNFDIHLIDSRIDEEHGARYSGMMIRYKGKGKPGSYDSENPDHTRFSMRVSPDGRIESITEILSVTNETINATLRTSYVENPENETEKAQQMLYRLKQEFGIDLSLDPPDGMELDMQATITDLIARAAEDPDAMPVLRYKAIETPSS